MTGFNHKPKEIFTDATMPSELRERINKYMKGQRINVYQMASKLGTEGYLLEKLLDPKINMSLYSQMFDKYANKLDKLEGKVNED